MDSRRTRQDGWRGWHYGVMVSDGTQNKLTCSGRTTSRVAQTRKVRAELLLTTDSVEGYKQFLDENDRAPLLKE